MNDQRWFDLAMKVIAGQATDAERAELDALLAREPEMSAEFARLEEGARVTKDALPLVDATRATTGELPPYARGRLQTKVRLTLGGPAATKEADRSLASGWRWVMGLMATAAVVLLVVLPLFRTPSAPVVQLAMLDTTGGTRGTDTNEAALLRETWSKATLNSFTSAEAMRGWETKDTADAVKVIYDRAAAEVRVLGKWRGKSFGKTFLVDADLPATLREAKSFIAEQTHK